MWEEIIRRYHLTNSTTDISLKFLDPDNVENMVRRMEKEASIRKKTYGGKVVPTTYTVEEVYPLFESFLQKPKNTINLTDSFHQHVQLFIATDVQNWRYAYDKHNRGQIANGYMETQVFAQPFRRRLAPSVPQQYGIRVKKMKTTRIPMGFNILNSVERRNAAMKEAGLL